MKIKIILVSIFIGFIININFLYSDTISGPPSAKNILVVTGGNVITNTLYELRNQAWQVCDTDASGHHPGPINNVTTASSIPADLSAYDQVWDMRFDQSSCADPNPTCSSSLTSSEQASLRTFMSNGGTVFLMGDNGGFDARNQGIIDFVNSVIDTSSGLFADGSAQNIGVLNANGGCCAVIDNAQASAAEDFGNDYSDLYYGGSNANATIWTEYPGAVILSQIPHGKPLYLTSANADFVDSGDPSQIGAIGVAFTQSDLIAPYNNGKLFVWFDWQTFRDQYCGTNYSNSRFIRNLMDFLVLDVDTPTPTPTYTYTSTNTPTDTYTETNTPTNTFTPTFTNTPTDSPTLTSTNTPTDTSTNTPTFTSTNTPTNTFTPTDTPTNTYTGTPPPTNTPTHTYTSTDTSTFTFTFTDTSTPTDTFTPTLTPTNTYTGTPLPTNTPTNTFTSTNTSTETFTPTDTYTFTHTYTLTNTYTETNTPTNTYTFTNTSTYTFTYTPTETYTPTDTPTITPTLPPFPYTLRINIYNSAGELVKEISYTRANDLISNIKFIVNNNNETNIVSTTDSLIIHFDSLETPLSIGKSFSEFVWDVDNDSGQKVQGGSYYIKIEQSDKYGHTNVFTKQISVINNEKYITLRIFNSSGEIIRTIKKYVYNTPNNISLNMKETLHLQKGGDNNVTIRFSSDPDGFIFWDGKNDRGEIVTNGIYEFQIVAESDDNKEISISKTVTVLREDIDAIIDKLKIFPNPVKKGSKVEFSWIPVNNGRLTISIYTLTGELVRKLFTNIENGKIYWNLDTEKNRNLYAGVYIVIIESKDKHGYISRKTEKIVILP